MSVKRRLTIEWEMSQEWNEKGRTTNTADKSTGDKCRQQAQNRTGLYYYIVEVSGTKIYLLLRFDEISDKPNTIHFCPTKMPTSRFKRSVQEEIKNSGKQSNVLNSESLRNSIIKEVNTLDRTVIQNRHCNKKNPQNERGQGREQIIGTRSDELRGFKQRGTHSNCSVLPQSCSCFVSHSFFTAKAATVTTMVTAVNSIKIPLGLASTSVLTLTRVRDHGFPVPEASGAGGVPVTKKKHAQTEWGKTTGQADEQLRGTRVDGGGRMTKKEETGAAEPIFTTWGIVKRRVGSRKLCWRKMSLVNIKKSEREKSKKKKKEGKSMGIAVGASTWELTNVRPLSGLADFEVLGAFFEFVCAKAV